MLVFTMALLFETGSILEEAFYVPSVVSLPQ